MSVLKQLQGFRSQAETEWHNNRRFRIGSIITFCLILLWILLQFNVWRQSRQEAATEAYLAYIDVQAAISDTGWEQRADLARQEYEKLTGWFWRSANPGEARARLRDWLEQKARAHGLNVEPVIVNIGRSPPGTGFVPVRAELKGQYQAGAWQDFMQEIGEYRPVLLVETEELDFRNNSSKKYQINVTGWFIIDLDV